MKITSLFITLLMATSLAYSRYSTVYGDKGAGTIGGGLGISQRSTNAYYLNNATNIIVLDKAGVEIFKAPIDQIENYVKHLTAGEYIAVYTNTRREVLWEIPFTID